MFAKLARKAAAIRTQKKTLKKLLHANRSRMQGGWYSFDGHIASCTSVHGSQNLKATKGCNSGPQRSLARQAITKIISLAAPPYVKYLRGGEHGGATHLLLTMEGNAKIFDYAEGTVTTVFEDKQNAARLLKAGKRLSPLPIIDLSPLPDGQSIVEPFCNGMFFFDLDLADQSKIFTSIIKSYSSYFSSKQPSYERVDELRELFSNALDLPLPPEIKKVIRSRHDSLIDKLVSCPVYNCHGDLHGKNILVDKNQPTIFDLDTICERPFFNDIVSLAYHEGIFGKMPLFDQLLDGQYHREICDLTDEQTESELKIIEMALLFFLYRVTRNPCRNEQPMSDREKIAIIAQPLLKRMELFGD